MISAIVLTKNEEKNIVDCLKSLSFCDEIIVIDDNSTDDTLALAKQHNAKVFPHTLSQDFSKQRNFGLSKASGDWILFVDADERISKNLEQEIMRVVSKQNTPVDGYYVKRFDVIWGKLLSHGEIGNLRLLRLVKHNSGTWKGQVHETLLVKGQTQTLKNPLVHYPHPSVAQFLEAINIYSTIRANELYGKKGKTNAFQIVLYPTGKFVQNFIFRFGFLDGTAGLVFALIMSFHSFLVRGKLWLLWQKK
ncbi:MAG: glycosyltransferase family 2 protein [Patescibacteria group bacterium]|nr:glycosyltransferase family 2 protein [Patescibacteria group bacterium]